MHIPEIWGITVWTNQKSFSFPIGFVMETAYNFIPIPQICHYIKERYCYWRMNGKSASPALQATALFRAMVILSAPSFQAINISHERKQSCRLRNALTNTSSPTNFVIPQFCSYIILLVRDKRTGQHCFFAYSDTFPGKHGTSIIQTVLQKNLSKFTGAMDRSVFNSKVKHQWWLQYTHAKDSFVSY